MTTYYKFFHLKNLYIFFIFLSLNIIFFSTDKVEGKAFDIEDIKISRPFEINFDKKKVIDEGFQKAFSELILLVVNSSDQKKIVNTKLNEIKGMIDSFSIKEEKFINEEYFVNLGVSFNRKEFFKFLEKRNIFPSIPLKNKFLFIPIIIDENKEDLLIFNNNKIFDEWNNSVEELSLIEYILPTEDLEDINLIKKKYEFIEKYDFKEITDKYYLNDSIILLVFKNEKNIRALSRIKVKNNVILKNQSFLNIDIDNNFHLKKLISELKVIYEDHWKNMNQINTSIKLSLYIKLKNSNYLNISNFENIMRETDLIYDFFISKIDKDHIYYEIIFNGTPDIFLDSMQNYNYNFDTQNKIWTLK